MKSSCTLRSILSESITCYFICLHDNFNLPYSSRTVFNLSYKHKSLLRTTFKAFPCPLAMFINPSFSCSSTFNSFINDLTSSSFANMALWLYTFYSCLLHTNILLLASMIANCCCFIYNRFSLISSSYSSTRFRLVPNFFRLFFPLSRISSSCLANS